jgi:DeoR/GlpR family transcriptional regulator of sugar metabolism
MAYNERLEEIAQLIQKIKKISVGELCERFGVSEVTIRKDLDKLQDQGILLRTHGSAVLAEDKNLLKSFDNRTIENLKLKSGIAQRASTMVREGYNVLIDSGTTTLLLARQMADKEVGITTNSLAILNDLMNRRNGDLTMLGGSLIEWNYAMIGPLTMHMLDMINVDITFLGVAAFDTSGFMCQNAVEALVKTKMLDRAKTKVVLADSSKFGKSAFTTFAQISDVDVLITDENIDEAAHQELVNRGVEVIVATADEGISSHRGLQIGETH